MKFLMKFLFLILILKVYSSDGSKEYNNCLEMSKKNPTLNIKCDFLTKPKESNKLIMRIFGQYKQRVKDAYNKFSKDVEYNKFFDSIITNYDKLNKKVQEKMKNEPKFLQVKRADYSSVLDPAQQSDIKHNFMKAISSQDLYKRLREQKKVIKEKDVVKIKHEMSKYNHHLPKDDGKVIIIIII
jgi:hypothetical protein